MAKIEFRLLQYVISHVTGDRVSVGLLHWDGRELRVASSLDHLSVCAPGQRDVVRTSVKLLVRRAKAAARRVAREPELLGLRDLFPVREGLGSALYWAPVTTVETTNPAAHFAQLSATLRLDRERARQPRRFSAKVLAQHLVTMGDELKGAARRRIKTQATVKAKKQFHAPLSWKNGRWHHAVPFSLDGLDAEEIDREVERLVGLVQLSVPTADVPVLVTLMPEQRAVARRTKREAELVCATLERHHCEIVAAELRGKSLGLERVRERVERDVGLGPRTEKRGRTVRSA
jgi:hypothetical protein